MFFAMAKPNYQTLLAQIAAESNTVIKQQLIDECYIFTEELTSTEEDLFNYVSSNYIENNPGIETFISTQYYPNDLSLKANSYVGVYYDEDGIA
jgi:hypothetical protein